VTTQATTSETPSAEQSKYAGPEPRRYAIAEGQWAAVLTAAATGFLRFGSGGFAKGYAAERDKGTNGYTTTTYSGKRISEKSKVSTFARPKEVLQIYEFEGCPFCRKVREGVSMLDLDVLFYPCPKDGPNFRKKAIELGGKQQFPYLVDPNTGVAMYESADILKYLFKNYGDGEIPRLLSSSTSTVAAIGLALAPRRGKGSFYMPSRVPEKPLIFWGYESCPFCKLVRETLSEMEIPHIQKSCPRGSPKRKEFLDKMGLFQVPYIEDPNTGVSLFESAEIIKYLKSTYGA